MMWLKGIFLFFAVQSVKSAIKNTCTTFQDYARIDSSPNCYHEPDVGLNTVRRRVIFKGMMTCAELLAGHPSAACGTF